MSRKGTASNAIRFHAGPCLEQTEMNIDTRFIKGLVRSLGALNQHVYSFYSLWDPREERTTMTFKLRKRHFSHSAALNNRTGSWCTRWCIIFGGTKRLVFYLPYLHPILPNDVVS